MGSEIMGDRPVVPTNDADEIAKGRIALWLEPEMIAFIANEWRRIPEDVLEPVKDRWSVLAFRAASALHKAGIQYDPVFSEE